MKKKISFIIPIILIFLINACSGYKPIFSSQNLEFKIVNSNIEGEKNLSDKILNKLEKISTRSNKTSNLIKNISILILPMILTLIVYLIFIYKLKTPLRKL